MFDFQKLKVYQKTKLVCADIHHLILEHKFNRAVNDQLGRASLSILLNIAEANSRFSFRSKKYLLVVSRGSAFECVAILEYLHDNKEISHSEFDDCYSQLEQVSKMLYALIKKIDPDVLTETT